MNRPIIRVFGVVLVLFTLLAWFTTKWTVVDRDELRANPLNKRELIEQQRIARGTIAAGDGTIIARSRQRSDGTYVRSYPRQGLFAHAVGYSYLNPGQSGLERFYNDQLVGRTQGLKSTLARIQGRKPQGNDLRTALDPEAQRIALEGLAGRPGAVVALDPRTGRVQVMASVPGYDPNLLRSAAQTRRLNSAKGAPLLNRTTQAGYPPGSTFKIVTAIAAIDSGKFTPQSVVDGRNGVVISGVPLNNDAGENWGRIDLTTALTHSVNTVWAQVGESVGRPTLQRYMARLGFGRPVPVDLPRSERAISGERCKGKLVPVTSDCVDVGRMAMGQDKLLVTPLQMAMVAAAVANDGVHMQPYIATGTVDPEGRQALTVGPSVYSRVMSPATARKINAMMQRVVDEGTGTAAALEGIQVAGKTGTAERNVKKNIAQPWFIAFAPANDPRVAVAVTLEEVVGGFGGVDAAPIARAVMESLLR